MVIAGLSVSTALLRQQ